MRGTPLMRQAVIIGLVALAAIGQVATTVVR